MNFILDNEAFSEVYKEFNGNSSYWISNIASLDKAIDKLLASDDFKGQGADSLRSYFENVHKVLITSLNLLISTHIGNFETYKREYHGCIETDNYAYIKSSEIEKIKSSVNSTKKSSDAIDNELTNCLNSINDIFSVKRQNLSWVTYSHNKIVNDITNLINDVQECENKHYSSDFVKTAALMDQLEKSITDLSEKVREFKSNFTVESLSGISSWNDLSVAMVDSYQEYTEKEETYKLAADDAQRHVAQIKEDRENKAKAIKWVVVGLTVVASVAVIAATGGTATPLVLGVLGASTSVANKLTDDLTESYIENGSLLKYNNTSRVNWNDVGKDIVVSGVTGFATGYLGGSIGKSIGNMGSLSQMSKSTSFADRLVSSAITKGGTKVVTGAMDRTIETAIDETWDAATGTSSFNVGNILMSVVVNPDDPSDNIITDFGKGAIDGSVSEIVDTGVSKTHIDHYGLNSRNKFVSGSSGFAVEATKTGISEVASGSYESIIDAATTDKTLEEALSENLDGDKILQSMVSDGADGAADQVAGNKINGRELTSKDLEDKTIRSKIPTDVISDPDRWIKNGGSIYMDSEGDVSFESREMKARNTATSKPKDVLKYSGKKVDYSRSTVDNTQEVIGGHFASSTS